jgi:hypothetical protein
VSRQRSLRALLIALTVAGVSVPHLVAGEIAGSLPALIVGILVGLGCLRLGVGARTWGGRVMSAIGLGVAGLTPLIGYAVQEAAERESRLEATHVEPNALGLILTQAPLIVLALLAAKLLVAAVRTVLRVLRGQVTGAVLRRAISVATSCVAALLPPRAMLASSNGQRAPPHYGRYRLAPLG